MAGAPGKTVNGIPAEGVAYVFVEPARGWHDAKQTAELTASNGEAGDDLGTAVAVSANIVVAGGPDENGIAGPGAAYVFVEPPGGWTRETQTATLTAVDGSASDLFGAVVAVDSNTIAVESAFASPGPVYVFRAHKSGWRNASQTPQITNGSSSPPSWPSPTAPS